MTSLTPIENVAGFARPIHTPVYGKRLKRIMVTNWLGYVHNVLDVGDMTFIQGDTGTGKSALCDAVQLALYCDVKGRYFNKAASDKSDRTLEGYLKGMLAHDESDQVIFRRTGTFSSHIALEFHDEIQDRWTTILAVFDVENGSFDSSRGKRFFVYTGRIPEDHFIRDDIPLNAKEIRSLLQERSKKKEITGLRDNQSGRAAFDDVCSAMGAVGNFAPLMKRAAAFSTKIHFEQFINEYVCGEGTAVDVRSMMGRYESLMSLRKAAEEAESKVEDLKDIEQRNRAYFNDLHQIQVLNVMDDFLRFKNAEQSLSRYELDLNRLNRTKSHDERMLQINKKEREESQKESYRLNTLIASDNRDAEQRRLKDNIQYLHNNVSDTKQGWARTSIAFSSALQKAVNGLQAFVTQADTAIQSLPQEDNRSAEKVQAIAEQCQKAAKETDGLNPADYSSVLEHKNSYTDCAASLAAVKDQALVLRSTTEDEARRLKDQKETLEAELSELKKGRTRYPETVIGLKSLLTSKICERHDYQKDEEAHVDIVADRSSVPDARWQNAMEAYLRAQKYYIMVDSCDYAFAMDLYAEYRKRLGNKARQLRTGIIDLKKVRRKLQNGNYPNPSLTLAGEIVSDDPRIQDYLRFLLGRVFKSEDGNRKEMRRHDTAITPECFLYSGTVFRTLSMDDWQHPVIGQRARDLRMQTVADEITQTKNKLVAYQNLSLACALLSRSYPSALNTDSLFHDAEAMEGTREKEKEIEDLKKKLAEIDTSDLDVWKQQLDILNGKIRHLDQEIDKLTKGLGTTEEQIRSITNRKETCRQNVEESLGVLERIKEDNESLYEEADHKFDEEFKSRNSLDAVEAYVDRQKKSRATAAENKRDALRNRRESFNNRYKLSLQYSDDTDEFADHLRELETTGLAEKKAKLKEFEQATGTEFRQNIVDRLRDDFETVHAQIKDLNYVLGRHPFQGRIYRFKLEPQPASRALYNAIMDRDDMDMDPQEWMERMNAKHGSVLDDFYHKLFDADGSIRISDEKEYASLLDYRSYIRVDMHEETRQADGKPAVKKMSRDMGLNSGGEGQLPFFLVVLASFLKQYRITSEQDASTMRLVIFDEAFSKVSPSLIGGCVDIAKELGLQCLFLMPHIDKEVVGKSDWMYYVAKGPAGGVHILPWAELEGEDDAEDSSLENGRQA